MDISLERSRAIVETMDAVQAIMETGATIENLDKAKAILLQLAARAELFPSSDFPEPVGDNPTRAVQIYKGKDGRYALYHSVVRHGFINAPHDHGNSWAIVVGIEGMENHHLFKTVTVDTDNGKAEIARAGEIMVEKGKGVSLLTGGIHYIEGVSQQSAINLHCYLYAFEDQQGRKEFNQENGTFVNSYSAAGAIDEMPLHAAVTQ